MKRSMLLILALLASASVSNGQTTLQGLIEDDVAGNDSVPPQRIGIPAPAPAPSGIPSGDDAEMKLSSNETGQVSGYCFDEYLIAPRRVMRFNNVLAGNDASVVRTASGKTMTLREAIASGAVSVKAVQLRVMFTNRTDEPITIERRGPMVLWDRPAGDVNPMALKALQVSNLDYSDRQNKIWSYTTAERRLHVLGYYDGSMWDYDQNRLSSAARRFQKENGLEVTGTLDNSTISSLQKTDASLRERLRRMGFADREGNSLHEDLAAQIRAYQRYINRPATGRWAPELGDRLAVDERIVRQLNLLQTAGKPMSEVLNGGEDQKDIVTYLNARRGTMVLIESPQGVELWNRNGRDLQFRDRGAKAIRSMDDAAAAMALQATKNDKVVIYPRVGTKGTATLAVGRRTVEVDGKKMAAYLAGGAIPTELAEAIDPLMPGVSSEAGLRNAPTVIVYRGPFVQRESGAGALAKLGMEQVDGAKLAKALDRSYGDRSNLYLSNDLRIGADRFRNSDMGSLRSPARSARLAMAR